MDIYQSRRAWKLYAMVIGVLIMVVLVIIYSSFLAQNLKTGERERVELLAKAYEDLFKDPENMDRDVTLATEIIEANKTIPVIIVDEAGEFLDAKNFPRAKSYSDILNELDKIRATGVQGIVFEGPGFKRSI